MRAPQHRIKRKVFYSFLLLSTVFYLGLCLWAPNHVMAGNKDASGEKNGFWQTIYQFFMSTPFQHRQSADVPEEGIASEESGQALPESNLKRYAGTQPISQIVLTEKTVQPELKITQWQKKQQERIAEIPDSYFDTVAFIGNSRTEGFLLYNGLVKGGRYGVKGMNVDDFFTKKVIKNAKGEKVTIAQDIKNKNYDAYYIMLGMNELGWAYENIFIDKYGQIIDTIAQSHPNSKIYVQSILPVSAEKSAKDPIYNNPKINHYNELLEKMCAEKGVPFLNVAEKVTDAEGALFADASNDGVHLNKKYCQMWFDYLKEQVALEQEAAAQAA